MDERRWILIAEDDEHIGRLIEFKLKRCGYEAKLARNGQEAVDSLGERPWSLLVLDIMMPLLDGWAVLRRARKTEELSGTPVLMLTAKNLHDELTARKTDMPGTWVLRKPFDPAELERVAASLIKKAPLPQEIP